MDMHIDGKQGLLTAEQEHTGGCFRPNALKAVQPGGAFYDGKFAQEIKVKVSTFFGDLAHDRLKARRFDLRPIYIGNGLLYLLGRGISYSFPGAKAFQEVFPGGSRLLV